MATAVEELTAATELALDPLKSKLRKPVNVLTGSATRQDSVGYKEKGKERRGGRVPRYLREEGEMMGGGYDQDILLTYAKLLRKRKNSKFTLQMGG